MRKFHFAQPFIASCGDDNRSVENNETFDINSTNFYNQRGSDIHQDESPTSLHDNSDENNGYISGAIDLDRALAEYYKSLVR